MHTIILVLLILSYKVQSTPITICSSKKGSNLVQGNFRQPRNFSIASTYRVLFQCRSQRGLSVSGLNRINYNLDSSIILSYIYILCGGKRLSQLFAITLGNACQGPMGAGMSLGAVGTPRAAGQGLALRDIPPSARNCSLGHQKAPAPGSRQLPEQGNSNSFTLFNTEARTPNAHLRILIHVSKRG